MALGAVKPLFDYILLRLFTLVVGPVGFIFAMVVLRILFWPTLFLSLGGIYLVAEHHYRNTLTRHRWKFWEPNHDHWKKR